MATNKREYFESLIARFWGAFGSGCGMPFDAEECVQAAKELGYYDTIKANIPLFRRDPAALEDAMNCCLRAGHLAADLAIHARSPSITGAQFKKAATQVQGRVERVRLRSAQRAQAGEITIMAGVCG